MRLYRSAIKEPRRPLADGPQALRTKPKVLLVLDHPAQQFVAAFRRTAKSTRLDLALLYWTDNPNGHYDEHFAREIQWDIDLHSGYVWHVPAHRGLRKAFNTWKLLDDLDPSIVLCFGWSTAVARLGLLWSIRSSTPVLLYGDSTWQSNHGSRLAFLRPIVLKLLFHLVDGALSTGTYNRDFYILHGLHPQGIHPGVCPVDVEAYRSARPNLLDTNHPTIGFAGKFIPRKGVAELLDALALLKDNSSWRARLIGDGPLRDTLMAQVDRLGLTDRVEFTGFVNTAAMPAALASCDIVVVPSSQDLRVLVAAEAMAAGCTVVVSSKTAVWGPGDLVEDRVTGLVYQSGDPASLAYSLRTLLEDQAMRDQLRAAGTERAERFGPEAFTATLERAIERTLGS